MPEISTRTRSVRFAEEVSEAALVRTRAVILSRCSLLRVNSNSIATQHNQIDPVPPRIVLIMRVLLASTVIIHAALSADVTLVSFDGTAEGAISKFIEMNDPVMGGQVKPCVLRPTRQPCV